MSSLMRQTAFVAGARLANQGALMVCAMLIGHVLSRGEAGVVQKLLLLTNLCVLVGMFGVQTALFTQLPKFAADQRRGLLTQSTLLLGAIGTLLAAIIMGARTAIVHYFQEPALNDFLPFAALAVWVALPAAVAEPLLITQKRSTLLLAVSVVCAAVHVALVATAALYKPQLLPAAMMLGLALAAALRLSVAALYATAKMQGAWLPAHPRHALGVQLAFILPVGAVSAIDTIATMLDRNIVAYFFTTEQFSLYAFGAMEIPLLGLIIGSVTPVLLPEFSAMIARGNVRQTLELWHRVILKTAVLVFGIFFVFLCIAPDFLALLYSEKYRESAVFMRIYLLLLPLRIVTLMPLLYAFGRQKLVLAGSCADLALNLCLSLLLVRCTPLGMAGAATATVVSTALQSLFYLWIIRRAFGNSTTATTLLPWRTLTTRFTQSAMIFTPAIAVCTTNFANAPARFAIVGLCLATYAALFRHGLK